MSFAPPTGPPIARPWTVTFRGDTFTPADITVEHLRIVAELAGFDSWDWIDLDDIHPARGPLRLLALLVARRCVADGIQGRAAVLRVAAKFDDVTLTELTDAITLG